MTRIHQEIVNLGLKAVALSIPENTKATFDDDSEEASGSKKLEDSAKSTYETTVAAAPVSVSVSQLQSQIPSKDSTRAMPQTRRDSQAFKCVIS